jgi:hypothetical protein
MVNAQASHDIIPREKDLITMESSFVALGQLAVFFSSWPLGYICSNIDLEF